MPSLMLKCGNCAKIFPSGIGLGIGANVTFINSKSQCPFCGSMENIPDGTFRTTVEGMINTIEGSLKPIETAKELLIALQNADAQSDLSIIQSRPNLKKFEKWLPNTPEKIAAYIAIAYTLVQLLSKAPSITYEDFVEQYNQNVNITQIDQR